MKNIFSYILGTFLLLAAHAAYAQNPGEGGPKDYTIRNITVESNSDRIDKQFVILLSGLKPGGKIKIPGEDLGSAIRKLWGEKVFSNIKIYEQAVDGDKIDLAIYVEERPRLSQFTIKGPGISKSVSDDVRENIKLFRGEVVTEYLLKTTEYRIKDFFAEKNYLDTRVEFRQIPDSSFSSNAIKLEISIYKNEKVRVNRIIVEGNKEVKLSKIRRKLKDALIEKSRVDVGNDILALLSGKKKFRPVDSTALEDGFYEAAIEYFRNSVKINIFKSSKYVKSEYENSKDAVVALYNAKGFRDAHFVADSVYLQNGEINAYMKIDEGRKYYFRNINWVGNKRYRSGQLDSLMNIRKGEVYNQEKLEQALRFNQNGGLDVTSMYQDVGYLFFNVEPVEVLVEGDSIDLEIRIYEGKQARIRNIIITGNTKTNDNVILREIRSKPGDLFSRSDILRSQTALSQLGIFDAQGMDVRPIPNPVDGTVDLEFIVAEAPSDQIELSGGWGANQIVGTLGLTFNNFSVKNIFKKGAWTPLPSGDGQRLSLRAQSNGPNYQSYNFSFTEPWLGGKKPISFSVFFNHSVIQFTQSTNPTKLINTTAGISVGKQLKWPDDYFSMLFSLTYQRYDAENYRLFSGTTQTFTGISNNFSFTAQLQRNSTNDLIFPSMGSNISASVELTPPYSLITGEDFTNAPLSKRYQFLEYHKWKFKAQWFVPLTRNHKFVMMARGEFGFMGFYNSQIGATPFERFFLGGDGLTGFNIDGREIISLRGYTNSALTPGFDGNQSSAVGGSIYSKYTVEFRYLISPNPQAKIYALTFLEAGQTWDSFDNFTPFKLNRSVGAGVRIFLPMFGLLGVDYGWGFDPVRGVSEDDRQKGNFHFMIGQQF